MHSKLYFRGIEKFSKPEQSLRFPPLLMNRSLLAKTHILLPSFSYSTVCFRSPNWWKPQYCYNPEYEKRKWKKIYKNKITASCFPSSHSNTWYNCTSTHYCLLASVATACSVAKKREPSLHGSRNASGIHATIGRTSPSLGFCT